MNRLIAFALLTVPLLAHSADPNWIHRTTLPNGAVSYYDMNNSYYKDGQVHVLLQLKYPNVVADQFLNIQYDKLIGFTAFPCDPHSFYSITESSFFYLNNREIYQPGPSSAIAFAPGSSMDQARILFCSKFKR